MFILLRRKTPMSRHKNVCYLIFSEFRITHQNYVLSNQAHPEMEIQFLEFDFELVNMQENLDTNTLSIPFQTKKGE